METSISRMYSEVTFHCSGVWQRVVQFYLWCMSRADPRVANWPMMSSPWPTLAIAAVYLAVVFHGRRYMMQRQVQHPNRKPLQLRYILVPYNLAMALLNLYIGLELAVTQYRKQYNWLCQPVNYSQDPDEIRIAGALWWYYISRLVEMMDTIFLVARQKWRQLTFLHVYHHSTMFCLWWIGVKWVPGGSAFFAAMVNSLIHVIMYSYYALAAAGPGPAIQKYLGWKKYLTILQMAQFVSALVLGIRALVYGCDFPLWMQYALVVYMGSFLVLFGNYYRNAYLLQQQQQQQQQQHRQRNPSATINKHFSSIIKNGHANSATTVALSTTSVNNGSSSRSSKSARHNGHNNGKKMAGGAKHNTKTTSR